MTVYHPALAFKKENVHQDPVWHSARKFVYYDMFLPVTFPAKKKHKTKIASFQWATTFR